MPPDEPEPARRWRSCCSGGSWSRSAWPQCSASGSGTAYWLAIVVVATISLWGDAFGHIHQEIANDNHDSDNTGAVLYADILFPLVALALYLARERLSPEQRAA